MKKLLAIAAVLGGSIIAGIAPAQASTYTLSFDSVPFDVLATVDIDGLSNVTSIVGTVTGVNGAPISGLVPLVPPDPAWIYDNQLFPALNPVVTNSGLLFTAGSWIYNLYSVIDGSLGTLYYLSTYNPDGTFYNPGALGTLVVSEVPVPPALLLFGSALAGIGFLARAKRKKAGLAPALA